MNYSPNNQRLASFRDLVLVLSELLALASGLKSFPARSKLMADVKKLSDQWPELAVTIEKELEESVNITRYTYILIDDFVTDLYKLTEGMLDSGFPQWANKSCSAMEILENLLRQNSHLFLSTEQELRQSGRIKYSHGDSTMYHHYSTEVRTSLDRITIRVTEDGLIIEASKKQQKRAHKRSKTKNNK